MKWSKYRIHHSQKNMIDLYCRQKGEQVEVYTTNADDNKLKVLTRDILTGNLSELVLDQYSNPINWELVNHDFSSYKPEFDMAEARKRHGHTDNLEYIKYQIANAINNTHNNRGFSRYLKKNIIGTWAEKQLTLSFSEDGTYVFKGKWKPSTALAGVPETGTYTLSSNMLLFWGNQNSGVRTQIVDLVDDKIYFPGYSGQLFFTMTKQ
ncbi:MAG: hypothetical protein L6Q81_04090 [Bacteroidia bacterium]|nr:hypothetical protein [Bacteroidia bacterium]